MRNLCVDRFEGTYAICEELTEKPVKPKDIRYFAIDKGELPQGTKEGSVLRIDGEGTMVLDEKATEQRRASIRKRQKDLWE